MSRNVPELVEPGFPVKKTPRAAGTKIINRTPLRWLDYLLALNENGGRRPKEKGRHFIPAIEIPRTFDIPVDPGLGKAKQEVLSDQQSGDSGRKQREDFLSGAAALSGQRACGR